MTMIDKFNEWFTNKKWSWSTPKKVTGYEPSPSPSHLEILQEKLKLINNTVKFAKFIHWIINDSTYGLKLEKRTDYYKIVSDLYQDWIDMGTISNTYEWSNVKANTRKTVKFNLLDCTMNPYNAYLLIDNFAYVSADITLLGIKSTQEAYINKLNELINEDELFTEDDYDKE